MATAEKTKLEQRQREEAAERKEKGQKWETKLFRYAISPSTGRTYTNNFPPLFQAYRRELAVHDTAGEEAAGEAGGRRRRRRRRRRWSRQEVRREASLVINHLFFRTPSNCNLPPRKQNVKLGLVFSLLRSRVYVIQHRENEKETGLSLLRLYEMDKEAYAVIRYYTSIYAALDAMKTRCILSDCYKRQIQFIWSMY